MKNINYYLLLVLFISFLSCKAQPEPINYGHDDCSFCKMAIVDKAHSAQMVTKKGKQYKFDAIECMANYVNQNPEVAEKAILLVADYKNPGTLTDAPKSYYLISRKIKSPMGANLSAVKSIEDANKLISEFGGEIYTWDSLLNYFKE